MTVANSQSLSWENLHAAKFAFETPFHLCLSDGQIFTAEKIVRLIPKRRMVVFGQWQGKEVVAKLFFDLQHAKRHMEKDISGIRLLQTNKIPTPPLYYEGKSTDERIYVLLFQRIIPAQNLEELWQKKENVEEMLPFLKRVVQELATQHVLGILQHDLHLKNFLFSNNKIYILDGAEIELVPNVLSKAESMNKLTCFFSQLGVSATTYQEKLFCCYAESRGWILKKDDFTELHQLIKKWDKKRWMRFGKKIFRESTNFVRIHERNFFGMFDRSFGGSELLTFLRKPDELFQHPTAKLLKSGRSATIVKVTLDGRDLVVKRYNLKDTWHRIRRALRHTRAYKAWRLAHKLDLFGIPTAKPVAFIEKRFLGLRDKSYFITEYVTGEQANEFFLKRQHKDEVANVIKKLTELLKDIAKLDVTHGDLKITNILIDAQQQPVLIDLDGAKEHTSMYQFRKTWRKEIERFLRNFQHQPSVLEQFKVGLLRSFPRGEG